jgi:hypothetical protein
MQKMSTAIVSAINKWGFHLFFFGSGSLTHRKGMLFAMAGGL